MRLDVRGRVYTLTQGDVAEHLNTSTQLGAKIAAGGGAAAGGGRAMLRKLSVPYPALLCTAGGTGVPAAGRFFGCFCVVCAVAVRRSFSQRRPRGGKRTIRGASSGGAGVAGTRGRARGGAHTVLTAKIVSHRRINTDVRTILKVAVSLQTRMR